MADNMMYRAKRAGKNQYALPADSDRRRHSGMREMFISC